ncbi:MAG: NAD(P)-binding protein [Xanthomonadales bacterium]
MALTDLEPHLAERCLELQAGRPRAGGEFILYWAHHALRAHDNPALDTAAAIARSRGLPLLVYQGLGGRHRYNADRHHRFILEAARDFSGQLEDADQRLVFHLPEDPLAVSPLPGLLERSAAVVSDLYPVPPFPAWYGRHVERNPDLPWLLVDASCILPMPMSREAPTRAFRFRNRWRDELERRVATGWPKAPEWPESFQGEVGFEPFDLGQDFEAAIARCRIDHAIPPVADTPGGSNAGYRRWSAFLASGLERYHRRRNDAAEPEGVSRMSAYLHYGCVSPFRIAGEAAARGGEGAEKFLDELLVWRELSHHFCLRSESLETLDALPGWAAESLRAHEADPRERTFDWETLAGARTGHPLWDLAQRSLLRRGELHNNLRMTWGKAFLPWTHSAARAQKLMIDLNHRYALDGSDPNSYGGLLWCLGQFDRAFPPGPVFGKVRQRSLDRHAARLDMNAYARVVAYPPGRTPLRVAVVGAGLAGLTAARILDEQGFETVVVDKGRGAGGRMSTRRVDEFRFDHGAQYFTARDPRFLRHVVAWRERGLIEAWRPRIAVVGEAPAFEDPSMERYVAVPGMSAVCSDIAARLPDCRFEWEAAEAMHSDAGWTLRSTSGESLTADALLVAIPPEQARALLGNAGVDARLGAVEMLPCWTVMAVLDRPLLPDHDAAFVNAGPLSWIASQDSRPGREAAQAWVLHASPEWSQSNLEMTPDNVGAAVLEAAMDLPVAQAVDAAASWVHRWRYSRAREPLDDGALWFADESLAVAGDWCHGSRVEGAFLSGAAAAGRILASAMPAGVAGGSPTGDNRS